MNSDAQQLRVLHVINHDQQRGAENVAWALAQGLESGEVRNRIVALGPPPSETPALGAERLSRDRVLNSRGILRRTRQLGKLIKAEEPHVVLAHGGQACLHCVLASPVPVVWHRILELPQLSTAQRMVWSLVARRSAAAIAITDRLERELTDLGHRGPVLRVPNVRPGAPFRELDHVTQRNELIEELAIQPDGPILGFVGHLVEQKDPLLAIEAFEIVAARLPSASFLIAGDGRLGPAVRLAASRSSVGDRIRVLGHRDDVPSILSGLDLLVLTSRSESMAGVSVEAALAGCPVVACDFDGAAEVIEPANGGQIVERRQAADIALAVLHAVADREALTKARVSIRSTGERFQLERHLSAYRNFLAAQSDLTPRVLYLMPDIGVGGAERALAVIARHHDRKAMRMEVATLRGPRRPAEETVLPQLQEMGVAVTDLHVSGRADRSPVTLLKSAARLRRLCRSRRFHIVDSCLFEADLVSRLSLIGLRTKHVVHLVNTPYAPALDNVTASGRRWRRRLIQQVDKHSGRLTDHFVAITSAVMTAARDDLGVAADRVSVIGRGVDLTDFKPLPMPELDGLRVLSIGRLVPQKAHDTAIRAVALAIERGLDVSLTIYGEGPLHEELNALVETLAVGDRIQLPGPVQDVRNAHRKHHVFVFPSRWEGQGNALLEAMACARPVIVTDLPVFDEVVGPLGRRIRVDAVDDLAEQITNVAKCDLQDLVQEGMAIREWVEGRYSAPTLVRDLQAAYCDLFRQKGGASN